MTFSNVSIPQWKWDSGIQSEKEHAHHCQVTAFHQLLEVYFPKPNPSCLNC